MSNAACCKCGIVTVRPECNLHGSEVRAVDACSIISYLGKEGLHPSSSHPNDVYPNHVYLLIRLLAFYIFSYSIIL